IWVKVTDDSSTRRLTQGTPSNKHSNQDHPSFDQYILTQEEDDDVGALAALEEERRTVMPRVYILDGTQYLKSQVTPSQPLFYQTL
ncbi:hypothetical protein HAX54_038854, partial [Datura stramonium]|nr:hypothetical protein [Datura stramonium]